MRVCEKDVMVPIARPSVKLCRPSPMMTIQAADAIDDDGGLCSWL